MVTSACGLARDEAGGTVVVLLTPGPVAVAVEWLLGQAVAETENLLEGVPELLAEPAVEDKVAGRLHGEQDHGQVVKQLKIFRVRKVRSFRWRCVCKDLTTSITMMMMTMTDDNNNVDDRLLRIVSTMARITTGKK